ncbi:CHAT domain-containing protein [Corallococcus sp. AB032C]|uniref:CHAT domain-containing protein n=1 Tax=Corallococcus TaxID=83461 RepID=UPI000EC359EF|nr:MULTISPECIES: CHAT domain-containing protein [Corallococcus]NPC47675.1 CHAT domain-containing protein [Corallococcus exiguus]RKH77196.1 CHAT domain-containing protein [Corallococcus sp. AB032C]
MPFEPSPVDIDTILARIKDEELRAQLRVFWEFRARDPPEFGMVDILCLGQDETLRLLASFVIGTVVVDIEGMPTFDSAHIVMQSSPLAIDTLKSHALELLSALLPNAEPEVHKKFIETSMRFYHPTSYEADALLDCIRAIPPNSAVVVHNAAYYRGETVAFTGTEDEWVHQLSQLSQALSKTPVIGSLYVQLLSGRTSPQVQRNVDALLSLSGAFWGRASHSAAGKSKTEALREWVSTAESGQVEHVLSEIDKSVLDPEEKAVSRAICLGVARRHAQAFAQVAPYLLQLQETQSAEQLIVVAELAVNAREKLAARTLLREALERARPSLMILCRICRISWQMGDEEMSHDAQTRILGLYPVSGLKALVEQRLEQGRILGLDGLIRVQFPAGSAMPDWALYGLLMSDAFSTSLPKIGDAIGVIARQLPGRADEAVLDCARFALLNATRRSSSADDVAPAKEESEAETKLRWYSAALDALEARQLNAKNWSWAAALAIESITEMLISSKRKLASDSPEINLLRRAFDYVVGYIAQNPKDQARRSQFSGALSTDAVGANGFVILLWVTLTTPVAINIKPPPQAHVEVASLEVFMSFFEEYWSAKSTTDGGVPLKPEPLGQTALPASPAALLRQGIFYLDHMAWRLIADEADVQVILKLLKACIDLAEVSPDVATPAQLLRVAADGCADAGAHQSARDLAEEALFLRGPEESSTDRWFAWTTYSDVYHRLGNPHEALIGWLCANAQGEVSASYTEIFPFVALLSRILRDLRFYDEAREQAGRARQLLTTAGVIEEYVYRVDELEASIELKRLISMRDAPKEDWESLAKGLTALVGGALDRISNAVVSTVLLAQAIRRFLIAGWILPTVTNEIFARALELLGEPQSSRIQALASINPGLESVRHFSWGVPKVRNIRDLAEDVRKLSLIAERVLGTAVQANSPVSAVIAIELLADHTVGLLQSSVAVAQGGGQLEANSALEVLTNPAALVGFATRLGSGSIEIHALGQTEDGNLVHVGISNGELAGPKMEPVTVFDQRKLGRWREEYPINYPYDPDIISDINALEQRMRGIGMSGPIVGSEIVIVRETALSDIPVNLLLCGGRLLGSTVPVSSVPSLTWLRADMQNQTPVLARRVAWLLPADESGASPLSIMYEDLQKLLPIHSVGMAHGVHPGKVSQSELVIIAGHGSVWGRERYFKTLSGEDISSFGVDDVADAIQGSSIVVLLVCSAGRLDRDLFSSRSIGLPHRLLKQGCRAVVASPWPIKFTLASQWLGFFLDALKAGMTVSEATYYSNLELRDRHLRVSDFLAMHVIGNPFVKLAP